MRVLTVSITLLIVGGIGVVQGGIVQVDLSDADSNIEFASAEGRRLLLSQTTSLESYFMLAQHFVTQDTLGYCGHASATMALNAVRSKKSIVPQDKRYPGYGYYTQESWVGQSCVSNALGEFRRGGMGILDLEGALNCNAHARSAIVNESQAMKTVVKSIRKAMDERKVVIVNVFRRELDEKGWGHFSPLGAYNVDETGRTRFLFLDVSRYKYGPVWISEDVLFAAMGYRDHVSGQTRGYLVISASAKAGHQAYDERSYGTEVKL